MEGEGGEKKEGVCVLCSREMVSNRGGLRAIAREGEDGRFFKSCCCPSELGEGEEKELVAQEIDS